MDRGFAREGAMLVDVPLRQRRIPSRAAKSQRTGANGQVATPKAVPSPAARWVTRSNDSSRLPRSSLARAVGWSFTTASRNWTVAALTNSAIINVTPSPPVPAYLRSR